MRGKREDGKSRVSSNDRDEHISDPSNDETQSWTSGPGEAKADSTEHLTGAPSDLCPVSPDCYEIGEEVGRGGMGRIRSATDRRLGRRVLIKELLQSDPMFRARFEREALITARLQHPSIINVYEAGYWPSGEPFYAMNEVAGSTLDQVVTDAATLKERLALLPKLIRTSEALAYAHGRGIVHRDLKPSNVLVGEYGETVVIDWGLAKDLADSAEGDIADTNKRVTETVGKLSTVESGPSWVARIIALASSCWP
jgi:serine/threonine protein kinase